MQYLQGNTSSGGSGRGRTLKKVSISDRQKFYHYEIKRFTKGNLELENMKLF